MTIIPLLPQPEPEVKPYYRLLPAAWCYCCGAKECIQGMDCTRFADPEPPDIALARATSMARDALGLSDLLRNWSPAHIAVARQLAAEFAEMADTAERRRQVPVAS
ncbi:MAG TPA: hypothetical protein VLL08_31375 [Kineosporiaceae bacterium]|nr:hypothetical protein [Kineosporiaceae bacterium]